VDKSFTKYRIMLYRMRRKSFMEYGEKNSLDTKKSIIVYGKCFKKYSKIKQKEAFLSRIF